MWGPGIYFAEDASYSDNGYSYKIGNKRQLLLVLVFLGNFDLDTKSDKSLKRPPNN